MLKVIRKLFSSALFREGNDEKDSLSCLATWQLVVGCKMDPDSSHPNMHTLCSVTSHSSYQEVDFIFLSLDSGPGHMTCSQQWNSSNSDTKERLKKCLQIRLCPFSYPGGPCSYHCVKKPGLERYLGWEPAPPDSPPHLQMCQWGHSTYPTLVNSRPCEQ